MDITIYLNGFVLKLQNQSIHEIYSHVKAFQIKFEILENQFRTGEAFHLLKLTDHRSKFGSDGFAVDLNELKKETVSRFNDFRATEVDFNLS